MGIALIAHASNEPEVKFEVESMLALLEQPLDIVELADALDVDLTNHDRVRLYAIEHNVDQSLALNIACAESNFKADARNSTSSAGGVYQYIDSTWASYSSMYWGHGHSRQKLNANDNIELTMWVLSKYGTADWNASKLHGLGGGWSHKRYEQGLCG